MPKVYAGFNFADSMLRGILKPCTIRRTPLRKREFIGLMIATPVEQLFNSKHKASLRKLEKEMGFKLSVRKKPHRAVLTIGDKLLVATLEGMCRGVPNELYTDEMAEHGHFRFSLYEILE